MLLSMVVNGILDLIPATIVVGIVVVVVVVVAIVVRSVIVSTPVVIGTVVGVSLASVSSPPVLPAGRLRLKDEDKRMFLYLL